MPGFLGKKIGDLVEAIARAGGVVFRVRALRAGLVTNVIASCTVDRRQADMVWLNNAGGWSHSGDTPMHAYLNPGSMSMYTAHMVRINNFDG